MELLEYINSREIKDLVKNYQDHQADKQIASFNLFTISTTTSYLENFHSDILASLLNPNGLHKEGTLFLYLFLKYLNTFYGYSIAESDFTEPIVTRETGRLDIWIRDDKSKKSIIIENKMNNAGDMENQLDRYFDYAENARKYKVCAVLYLSLDGTKKAPPTKENFDHLVRNIGAFTSQNNDLLNGWLMICRDQSIHIDSHSFLHQYINLIKHLANKNMEIQSLEKFYSTMGSKESIEMLDSLIEMRNNIPRFRADKLAQSIISYKPFTRYYRYRPNYLLYEYYPVKDNNLKVDIWFEFDGSAYVEFWNPTVRSKEGRQILTDRLTDINMLIEFEENPSYADNGYRKTFVIGSQYQNIEEIDKALLSFLQDFMHRLEITPHA